MLGGSQLAGGVGRVLGPLWAGALFQGYSIGSPFVVGSAFSLVAIVLSARIPSPAAAGVEEKIEPTDRWSGTVRGPDPVDVTEPGGI